MKDKTAYVCENCGQESAKWIGKCPACGRWNTFKEIKVSAAPTQPGKSAATVSARGSSAAKVLRLRDISAQDDPRIDMPASSAADWFLAPSSCWAASRASASRR